MKNKGLCNNCGKLVPARHEQRGNEIYLIKQCPTCSISETLISRNAQRYLVKRSLDKSSKTRSCELCCLDCSHNSPNLIFVDITNRCNLNCPICINNTPSMGFLFEPPLDYFKKIFTYFAQYDPKPSIQLFGGEPTVRNDLFDIIRIARKLKMSVRLTTNGIRLADEEYCKKIIKTHTTILLAYDGDNKDMYTHFRGNGEILERKIQALDNIERNRNSKAVIMSLVVQGMNDHSLPDLFHFCHDRRRSIRGLYLMPLAKTFKTDNIQLDVERITTEDIENIFDTAFPEDEIDFIPAGFLGQTPNILKWLHIKPVPFIGAHPNCESLYILVSNGQGYVPIARYLKGSAAELCKDMLQAEDALEKKVKNYDRCWFGRIFGRSGMKQQALFLYAFFLMMRVLWKNFCLLKILKGKGLGKIWHLANLILRILLGGNLKQTFFHHTRIGSLLQVIILPFEDDSNLETDRLSRCPAGFAFYDPIEDKMKSVPVCAWGHFKTKTMRRISDFYKTSVSSVK